MVGLLVVAWALDDFTRPSESSLREKVRRRAYLAKGHV